MQKILLNPTDMLVSRLSDYFTKTDKGTLDTSITKDNKFNVGIIEYIGKELSQTWIGKIIYYHKDIGMEMDVKNIGKYDLITKEVRLLIRLDQDRNNY